MPMKFTNEFIKHFWREVWKEVDEIETSDDFDIEFETEIDGAMYDVKTDGFVYVTRDVTPATSDRLNPEWVELDKTVEINDVKIYGETTTLRLNNRQLKRINESTLDLVFDN